MFPWMNRRTQALLMALLLFLAPLPATAAELSPQEQAMTALAERIVGTLEPQQILKLTPAEVIPLLTPEERQALSTGHITFRTNVPAVVMVIRPAAGKDEPFWLADRGFESTGQTLEVNGKRYDAFERTFEAGEVSLGIGSFSDRIYPYFVAVKAVNENDHLEIRRLRPGRLKLGTLAEDVHPFVDRDVHINQLPAELVGRTLIRTSRSHTRDAGLLHRFRQTKYPASDRPDHVVLTWSDDPRTTMTIQWRTSRNVSEARVRYRQQGQDHAATVVTAQTRPLRTPNIINDPLIHLHAITLTGLRPGTTYEYALNDITRDGWTEWTAFTTAPATPTDFTFTYMGDAQTDLDDWGDTLGRAFGKFPESAFYILAGDLVNRGHDRDDWDSFFHNAEGVFDRRAFVPVLGNHEVLEGKPPTLYLSFFNLPQSGPPSIEPERAYAFEYGNALFVILDSNLDPKLQTRWLDEQLGRSQATWKFVSFHHPVYASHPERNHEHLLREWAPVFDRHGVDMVLQGHDHAYLRTHAMHGNERVDHPTIEKRGTYYVVSVSGTKFYPQASGRDYTAVALERTPTYQIIRIQVAEDRLHYRAFDDEGKVRDELVIDKHATATAQEDAGKEAVAVPAAP